jgi:hypothetical protein
MVPDPTGLARQFTPAREISRLPGNSERRAVSSYAACLRYQHAGGRVAAWTGFARQRTDSSTGQQKASKCHYQSRESQRENTDDLLEL